jgi:hypothetical protein
LISSTRPFADERRRAETVRTWWHKASEAEAREVASAGSRTSVG